MPLRFLLVFAMVLGGVAACGGRGADEAVRSAQDPTVVVRRGGDDNAAIAVNGFLWRATLETLDFMPLSSADPYGGVIITDWYANPEAPQERFKATVYILDARLRADAVNVNMFRQVRNQALSSWVDASVDPDTATQIEDSILTRARELRIETLDE